jgi:4-hydroxybenzoate polyprenyltransferase
VEDHDGDKIVGFTTMAILWGKSGTKIYIMILTATTLVGIAVVIWQLFGGRENGIIPLIGSAVLVLSPLFASLVTTSKAKTKESFHKASRLTKLTMAGGISCSVLIAGMYLDWF